MIFHKENKKPIALNIHLGNDNIQASLSLMDKSKRIVKDFYFENKLRDENNINFSKDILLNNYFTFLKEIKDYISTIAKPQRIFLDTAIVSISEFWKKTYLRKTVYTKDSLTSIDNSFLDFLIKSSLDENLKIKEDLKKDYFLFENQIIDIFLNGYKTNNPNNKIVKYIDANIMSSLCQKDIYTKINDNTKTILNINNIRIYSDTFVMAKSLSSIDNSIDHIIINILDNKTEFMIFVNETLTSLNSFPFGKKQFSEILKYENDDASNTSKKDWMFQFSMAIKEIHKTNIIPHNIFIISDENIFEILKNALMEDNTMQFSKTANVFNIVALKENIINMQSNIFNKLIDKHE